MSDVHTHDDRLRSFAKSLRNLCSEADSIMKECNQDLDGWHTHRLSHIRDEAMSLVEIIESEHGGDITP